MTSGPSKRSWLSGSFIVGSLLLLIGGYVFVHGIGIVVTDLRIRWRSAAVEGYIVSAEELPGETESGRDDYLVAYHFNLSDGKRVNGTGILHANPLTEYDVGRNEEVLLEGVSQKEEMFISSTPIRLSVTYDPRNPQDNFPSDGENPHSILNGLIFCGISLALFYWASNWLKAAIWQSK